MTLEGRESQSGGAAQQPIFKPGIRIVQSGKALNEETELWRYMRLSTLLMLLQGKVFIPTIEDLRRGDPIEGRNLCKDTRAYFDGLSEADLGWLLGKANETERVVLTNRSVSPFEKARTYVRIWDRELAKRRRIWCFHQGSIESMALWNIYAKEGTAIKTTPGKIKNAFKTESVDTALIGSVQYVQHARREAEAHHCMRPYLLKQRCYQYENEVRVILPRDPDQKPEHRLLAIDPRELIEEIRISPHLPRSEAVEVKNCIESLLHQPKHSGICETPIFISDSTTVHESFFESLKHNEQEPTGISNFGSLSLPYVICGDFA